jgi:hypothetical protein
MTMSTRPCLPIGFHRNRYMRRNLAEMAPQTRHHSPANMSLRFCRFRRHAHIPTRLLLFLRSVHTGCLLHFARSQRLKRKQGQVQVSISQTKLSNKMQQSFMRKLCGKSHNKKIKHQILAHHAYCSHWTTGYRPKYPPRTLPFPA